MKNPVSFDNNFVDGKFVPDKKLLSLAESFSKKYKKLKTGIYRRGKYTIVYKKEIVDSFGVPQHTNARIGNDTGVIQLGMKSLAQKEYDSNYVFYIILWCIACKHFFDVYGCNGIDFGKPYYMADEATLKYYVEHTNRPIKNLMIGMLHLFKDAADQKFNMKRIKAIKKLVNKQSK